MQISLSIDSVCINHLDQISILQTSSIAKPNSISFGFYQVESFNLVDFDGPPISVDSIDFRVVHRLQQMIHSAPPPPVDVYLVLLSITAIDGDERIDSAEMRRPDASYRKHSGSTP